jgi:heat shock protein HslJ
MWRIVRMMTMGLAAVGAGAVVACAGSLITKDLEGNWRLVEITSQPVQPTAGHALPMFTVKDQAIEGFDGCNRFWGRLDQPGSMMSTRRGCPAGTLKLPLDLADPLAHLEAGRVVQGRLILPQRGDIPEAVFERVE